MRRTFGGAAALLICVLCAGFVDAGPVFVKLGDIKGESTQEAHQGWMVVLAWRLAGESSGNGHGCGTQPPGQLVVTKFVDSTTPEIYRMFAECAGLREVILEAPIDPDPTSSEPGERVMRARFGGARIIRVEVGAPSGDDVPTEHITLTYDKVEFEIVEEDGGERSR
jgi:type VI secretion system secreted protein Hcp